MAGVASCQRAAVERALKDKEVILRGLAKKITSRQVAVMIGIATGRARCRRQGGASGGGRTGSGSAHGHWAANLSPNVSGTRTHRQWMLNSNQAPSLTICSLA